MITDIEGAEIAQALLMLDERVREAMNEADMLWRHGRRVVELGPDGRRQVRREPFASNADKWRAWRAALGTIRQRAAELEAFLAEAEGWKAASGRRSTRCGKPSRATSRQQPASGTAATRKLPPSKPAPGKSGRL